MTNIAKVGAILNDANRPLKERFRALFTLRGLGGQEAVDEIAKCFQDPSALLKHEAAYCLGQMGHEGASKVLRDILDNESEETIVRHEAGEALGALGSQEDLPLLRRRMQDPVKEVADTCALAVGRIEYVMSGKQEDLPANPYGSVDPAPPMAERDVKVLRKILLDEKASLFDRYRAMFSLRNLGTDECIQALGEGKVLTQMYSMIDIHISTFFVMNL